MTGKFAIAATFLALWHPCFAQEPDPLLSTRTGLEFGAQISQYQYAEPGLITLTGDRFGIVGAATLALESDTFVRLEARDSYGALKYESSASGSKSGVPDWLLDLRALAGLDFVEAEYSLSPYLGFGYRYLYNDLSGYSSTGSAGYQRYSNYFYAPLGLTARFRMDEGWVLAPTAEYDFFIGGKQISKLSEADPRLMDVTNQQHSGYGYRASLMLEKNRWTFGIWTQYWHIRDSDTQFAGVITGVSVFAKEPENTTREGGFEVRYRF